MPIARTFRNMAAVMKDLPPGNKLTDWPNRNWIGPKLPTFASMALKMIWLLSGKILYALKALVLRAIFAKRVFGYHKPVIGTVFGRFDGILGEMRAICKNQKPRQNLVICLRQRHMPCALIGSAHP